MPPFSDHHDMTDCCLRRTRLPSQSFTHSVSSIAVVVGGVNTTVFGLLGLLGLPGLLGLLGLVGLPTRPGEGGRASPPSLGGRQNNWA